MVAALIARRRARLERARLPRGRRSRRATGSRSCRRSASGWPDGARCSTPSSRSSPSTSCATRPVRVERRRRRAPARSSPGSRPLIVSDGAPAAPRARPRTSRSPGAAATTRSGQRRRHAGAAPRAARQRRRRPDSGLRSGPSADLAREGACGRGARAAARPVAVAFRTAALAALPPAGRVDPDDPSLVQTVGPGTIGGERHGPAAGPLRGVAARIVRPRRSTCRRRAPRRSPPSDELAQPANWLELGSLGLTRAGEHRVGARARRRRPRAPGTATGRARARGELVPAGGPSSPARRVRCGVLDWIESSADARRRSRSQRLRRPASTSCAAAQACAATELDPAARAPLPQLAVVEQPLDRVGERHRVGRGELDRRRRGPNTASVLPPARSTHGSPQAIISCGISE